MRALKEELLIETLEVILLETHQRKVQFVKYEKVELSYFVLRISNRGKMHVNPFM